MSLPSLPPELIAHIAGLLCLHDVVSLRLTNRAISSMTTHTPSFLVHFKSHTISLKAKSLRQLVHMTSTKHSLGCALQDCTIVGIVQEGGDADEEQDTDLQSILTEAFTNLKQHSAAGRLASLSLRVALESWEAGFYAWRPVWDAARRTFALVTTALRSSGLSVTGHLDLFGNVRGCSLACDAFLSFGRDPDFGSVLKGLKQLTLSLSAPYTSTSISQTVLRDDWRMLSKTQAKHTSLALARIIPLISHHLPGLEEFNLHWYNLSHATSLPSETATPPLPSSYPPFRLKKLEVRGLYTCSSSLLQLLSATDPATLSLTDIHLTNETTWDPILAHISSSESAVTAYHLDDLHTGTDQLLRFEGVPGTAKFPYLDTTRNLPSTLTRDEKAPIRSRVPMGHPFGSPWFHRWAVEKLEEFGPPEDRGPWGSYNFAKLNRPGEERGGREAVVPPAPQAMRVNLNPPRVAVSAARPPPDPAFRLNSEDWVLGNANHIGRDDE